MSQEQLGGGRRRASNTMLTVAVCELILPEEHFLKITDSPVAGSVCFLQVTYKLSLPLVHIVEMTRLSPKQTSCKTEAQLNACARAGAASGEFKAERDVLSDAHHQLRGDGQREVRQLHLHVSRADERDASTLSADTTLLRVRYMGC